MTAEQFGELLALAHELRNVEFKPPGPSTDGYLRGVVVKAVLGMANLRDGGRVILGVKEDSMKRPLATGLAPADLATWTYDAVGGIVSGYADPYVSFRVEQVLHDGKHFVILQVDEFEEVPVLCKKDHPSPQPGKLILRRGALYVRTRHKPETVEVPSQTEMREVLALATDKGVAAFVKRTTKSGAWAPAPEPTDSDRFREQIKDLL